MKIFRLKNLKSLTVWSLWDFHYCGYICSYLPQLDLKGKVFKFSISFQITIDIIDVNKNNVFFNSKIILMKRAETCYILKGLIKGLEIWFNG